jgi:hypothetical protein
MAGHDLDNLARQIETTATRRTDRRSLIFASQASTLVIQPKTPSPDDAVLVAAEVVRRAHATSGSTGPTTRPARSTAQRPSAPLLA